MHRPTSGRLDRIGSYTHSATDPEPSPQSGTFRSCVFRQLAHDRGSEPGLYAKSAPVELGMSGILVWLDLG